MSVPSALSCVSCACSVRGDPTSYTTPLAFLLLDHLRGKTQLIVDCCGGHRGQEDEVIEWLKALSFDHEMSFSPPYVWPPGGLAVDLAPIAPTHELAPPPAVLPEVCAWASPVPIAGTEVPAVHTSGMYNGNSLVITATQEAALKRARAVVREVPFCPFAGQNVEMRALQMSRQSILGMAQAFFVCPHCYKDL